MNQSDVRPDMNCHWPDLLTFYQLSVPFGFVLQQNSGQEFFPMGNPGQKVSM